MVSGVLLTQTVTGALRIKNCIWGTTHSPKLYPGHYALNQIVSRVLPTHPNCIWGASPLTQIVSGALHTHPNCIWGTTQYSLTQIVSGVLNIHQISNWGATKSPKLFLGRNGNLLIGFLSETLVFCKKFANERFFFKKKSNSLICDLKEMLMVAHFW